MDVNATLTSTLAHVEIEWVYYEFNSIIGSSFRRGYYVYPNEYNPFWVYEVGIVIVLHCI